ncbi:hypothetical protein IFM89_037453, partial [Coptis chinensis]
MMSGMLNAGIKPTLRTLSGLIYGMPRPGWGLMSRRHSIIKREISTMKLIRYPNVIRMYEVMTSKTKIYIVLEFVTGGELLDKIPENLLLDSNGALKVSDFGLSALPQQVREDGLLHTTCGIPNYVASEVVNSKGYDGAKADLWSCGGILFVLMAGYLPFEDSNLMALYKKVIIKCVCLGG